MTPVAGGTVRAFFAAAMLGSLLLSPVANAAPPAPVLSEYVTVRGARHASVVVTVPKDVNFRADGLREMNRPSVRFTGKAYGWLLQAEPAGLRSGFVGHVRMPAAEGGTVIFRMDGKDRRTGANLFETNVLPAGRYRLHLLSDGAGSVRFRLPGLRGSRTLDARAPSGVTSVTQTPPTPAGHAPPAYGFGSTIETDNGALALTFDWVVTTVQVAAHYGSCAYRGGPPAGQWLPGCPGGDTVIMGLYGPFVGCCGTGWGGAWLPPGRWGYGRWYDAAGPVERAGFFMVVIPQP